MADTRGRAEVINALAPQVKNLIKSLEGTDREDARGSKKVVTTVEVIITLLKNNDLTYKLKLHSRFVGFHKTNRYGDGVNAHDAIDLICEIFDVGFSWAKVDPIAFEIGPDDTETHLMNRDVADASEGKLAPSPLGVLKLASVGCGHTNQGLRAIDASCPCATAPDMTVDGKFNTEKVAAEDLNMGQAVQEGLDWTVFYHEVEEAFPELPTLIQEYLNIINQLVRPESELQIMCKMHRMAAAQEKDGGTINWPSIIAKCARSKPRCVDDLQDMKKYVEKFAGGTELCPGTLLVSLRSYVRAHAPSKRVVRGQTFAAFAALQPIGEDGSIVPDFINECMKAIYTAPSKFVKNNVCILLSPSDIAEIMGKHKPHVLQAAALFHQCSRIIGASGLKSTKRSELSGVLGSRLVMHVWQKTDPSRKAFASLEAACHQCVVDVRAALVAAGEKAKADALISPWDPAVPVAASAASADTPAPEVQRRNVLATYDAAGVVIDPLRPLREKEFKHGSHVYKATDPNLVYEIVTIAFPNVILDVFAGTSATDDVEPRVTVSVGTFLADYKHFKVKDVDFDGWEAHHPRHNLNLHIDIWKGLMYNALLAESSNHTDTEDALRLKQKPSKAVFALSPFATGALTLVPLSNNIYTVKPGASVPTNAISLGTVLKHPTKDIDAFISAKNLEPKAPAPTSGHFANADKDTWIAPFWWVRQTTDEAEANMKIVFKQCAANVSVKITKEVQQEHQLTLPLMVNTKKINVGGELVLYKGKEKRSMPTPPPAKKAKGSGKGNTRA